MNMSDYEHFADACFRDSKPPCACNCPFNLDIRKLVKKIQKGSISSVYKQYRDSVIFPGVVSRLCNAPCKEVCVRREMDGSIDLQGLESKIVSDSMGIKPNKYRIPPKNNTVAIVGAGVCGMACALRLASRGYPVTIYEKNSIIGGKLNELEDAEFFIDDIKNETQYLDFTLKTDNPVNDLDELKEYDAVLIATGAGGNDFGLLEGSSDIISFRACEDGIFLAGELIGADIIEAVAQGAASANAMEQFIKVGNLDGFYEKNKKTEIDQRFYDLPVHDEPVMEGEPYSEAHRCTTCTCDLCRDACPLIDKINKYPPKMSSDVVATLKPIESLTTRVGSRMINTCTFCGACGKVCPADVDMSKCLAPARTDLFEDEHLPSAYHHYWIKDMDFSMSEAAYLFWKPDGEKSCENVFFPGCQLGASLPEYVHGSYKKILEEDPNAALYLACCGTPAEWAGDSKRRDEILHEITNIWEASGRPHFILACPACKRYFERFLPDIDTISLYTWLNEHMEIPDKYNGEERIVCVSHPCTSKDDTDAQKSVIALVEKFGYTNSATEEIVERCCGFGGHIYAADPELFVRFGSAAIETSEHDLVAYCANCRDIFAEKEKKCYHILDMLLGIDDPERKPPTLSQRRKNRTMIKEYYTKSNTSDPHPYDSLKIIIGDDIQAKMDSLLILEEDIRQTIYECNETDNIVWDEVNDQYIAHLFIKPITYWVVYEMCDGKFKILNVYSHRLQVKE